MITLSLDNYIGDLEATEIRKIAEIAAYRDVEHGGHVYRDVALLDKCPVDLGRVCDLVGIDRQEPWLSYYYKASYGHETGSWIHADNSLGSYACLLYLPPIAGAPPSGTMMLRHVETGLRSLEPDAKLSQAQFDLIVNDSEDPSKWVVEDTFSERIGRLVVYPANRFHARFPKYGYGASADTSRIVMVAFLGDENADH